MSDTRIIYTVTKLNSEIKEILEGVYKSLWVEGEISNLKAYPSGHIYFTLKDTESQIRAVIFSYSRKLFKFDIENGKKYIVCGRVSSYVKRGEYQLLVDNLEPSGLGALQLAYEQLKEKLKAEGLFDEANKRQIPFLPGKIGIITSPKGAAIKDILSTIKRRFANVEILIYPVRVQGDEAKYEICNALDYFNLSKDKVEVILLGRGGGTLEDLWAFNEEMVARSIYKSEIPVISCVGHEVDYTISDFVSDLRAATPTAAAELVVKNKSDLHEKLIHGYQGLLLAMNRLLAAFGSRLEVLKSNKIISDPFFLVTEKMQILDELTSKLDTAFKNRIGMYRTKYEHMSAQLNSLSPLNILARGYSFCTDSNGKLIADANTLSLHDKVSVKLKKGGFKANVIEIEKN